MGASAVGAAPDVMYDPGAAAFADEDDDAGDGGAAPPFRDAAAGDAAGRGERRAGGARPQALLWQLRGARSLEELSVLLAGGLRRMDAPLKLAALQAWARLYRRLPHAPPGGRARCGGPAAGGNGSGGGGGQAAAGAEAGAGSDAAAADGEGSADPRAQWRSSGALGVLAKEAVLSAGELEPGDAALLLRALVQVGRRRAGHLRHLRHLRHCTGAARMG